MAEINLGKVKGDKGDTGNDGLTTAVKVGAVTYTHVGGVVSLPAYPSKTSDLTNDSGFITSVTAHNHDERYYTETEIDAKNTTTLSSAKTYADTVSATAKTEAISETQTWAKGTFTRKNLLIDGDFQLWLDGTSFAAPSNIYTATMWKCNGTGTVTKVASGMQITGTVTIKQIMETLEYNKISGKTVTLSYSLNGAITTSTYTASSSTVVNLTVTDKIINWIKLEEGDFRTPFESKPYGDELISSKRHYYKTTTLIYKPLAGGFVNTSTTASLIFELQTTMRQTPTITTSGTFLLFTSNVIYPVGTITVLHSSEDKVLLEATGTGMPVGYGVRLQNYTAGSYIAFDARP